MIDFKKEVLDEEVVLVDFSAEWCGPCKMLEPIFEELKKEVEKVKFVTVDIDKEKELSMKYGVRGVPCLILFKNGEVFDRLVGLVSKEQLRKWIEGNI
ncbi:thioredoxin [archaeon]|nr:thioredoxin [archaeon]|tara:strand:- start:5983 stop:6276 length:294 start_codon:yes stop_codon:yes gene_type:complete